MKHYFVGKRVFSLPSFGQAFRLSLFTLFAFLFFLPPSFAQQADPDASLRSPFWKPTFNYKKASQLPNGMLSGTGDPFIDNYQNYFFIYFGKVPLVVTNKRKLQQTIDISVFFVVKRKRERELRFLCDSQTRVLSYLSHITQRTPIKKTGQQMKLEGIRQKLSDGLQKKLTEGVFFDGLDIVEGAYTFKRSAYIGVKRNIYKKMIKTCSNYSKEEVQRYRQRKKEEEKNTTEKNAVLPSEIRSRYRSFRHTF